MSLFSVDSKDVGLLAFVKRNALKRLLSETYPKTARKRDFAHPGLEPRRFVDAFFIVKRAKKKKQTAARCRAAVFMVYIQKNYNMQRMLCIICVLDGEKRRRLFPALLFALPAEKLFVGGRYQYLSFSKKR